MSKNLLWKYLTEEDLQKLDNLTPTKIETFIADKFGLKGYEIDLKQACFLDYYVTQYWWSAKENSFNHEQISVYFSIVFILMQNLIEKKVKMYENLEEFKNILTDLNEKSKFFTDKLIKNIISHLWVTFFQNFKLFEYVAKESQSEVSITKEIEVECPKHVDLPYPAPLDESMPENMYNKYILKIPDEPSAEEIQKQELENPEFIQIPEKVVEQINEKFEGLTLDEARKIIFEVTNELMTDLKSDMRSKIKERESALLNELSKNQAKNQKK